MPTETLETSAIWTDEAIETFWQYLNEHSHLSAEYFSANYGSAILSLIKDAGLLNADTRVLDWGCGQGFLVERFLDEGVACQGLEFSERTARLLETKLKGRRNWQGVVTVSEVTPQSYDLITCIEVVEHLSDEYLRAALNGIWRALKPGGTLFLTTPNDEDLGGSVVFCPFCQAEFHKVQHVRAFTVQSMWALLGSHGFKVRFCEGISLEALKPHPLPRLMDVSLSTLLRWAYVRKNALADRLRPLPFPQGRVFQKTVLGGANLVAIATRQ